MGKLHTNDVVNELRREILVGAIKPNTFLRQKAIADRFHVSRTPAREALQALQSEGLVENVFNSGFKVRKMELRDILDIIDMRRLLEGYAARLAAMVVDPDLPHALREIDDKVNAAIARYYETKDKEHLFVLARHEQVFHQKIVAAGGNRLLLRLFTMTNLQFFIVEEDSSKLFGEPYTTHEQIIEAIEKGDPDEAEKRAQQHLQRYKRDKLVQHLGPMAVFSQTDRYGSSMK